MIYCPICINKVDQQRHLKTYVFDFYADQYKQEYKLYQCSSCKLQFWWPLKFVSEFYEKYLPKDEIVSLGYRKLSPYAELFFKLLPIRAGQLLDIGCGDGVFMQHAKHTGFDVSGIDLDEKCVKAAKEYRDLENVHVLFLDELLKFARKDKTQFDIITFFEVLEHQDNPVDFINNVKHLLKNGGYIVGSVPNRERFLAELDWKIFMGDFPPPHLTRWSKDVLEWFLKKAGFDNIECYPVGFKHKEQLASWYKAILLRGMPNKIINMFKKDRAKSTSDTVFKERSDKSGKSLNNLRSKSSMLFMPLALATRAIVSKKGTHIYFQAKFTGGL